MKKAIQKVINELGPKHFSRRVKNTTGMWNWVLQQTPFLENDVSISERIYVALSGENPICELDNRKKFKSFDEGYGFCGRANVCECARQSVSENVSKTKQQYTDEETAAINAKREKTTLKLHGVTNNAQTKRARRKHKEFYADPEKVKGQTEKHKQTHLDKYGVENPRHIPGIQDKIDKTCMKRYNVKNPKQSKEIKERERQNNLKKFGYERHTQRPKERVRISKRMRIIENQDDFQLYINQVNRWTRDIKKEYIAEGYVFGARNEDNQLDHIIPKIQGFVEGIPPWILGSRWNLQIMLGGDNKSKGRTFQPNQIVGMILDKFFEEMKDV